MSTLIGQTLLNRYEIRDLIGRGGVGEVYLAWDKQRLTKLAVKVLHEDLAFDRIFMRRFKREADTLAKLQHPNIVRFYRLEVEGHRAFMLLDYIEGETLHARLFKLGRPMTMVEIMEVMQPVIAALHYAHSHGIVHCDVKPANVMLEKTGRVLVGDFGIARMMDAATATLVGAGTPAYMAPEQIKGEVPTQQTDIYALGVMLYEMLTGGERPFTGERATITGTTATKVRWEHINLDPPPMKKWNPNIPPEVEAAVMRCLVKAPEERYANVQDLLADLSGEFGEVKPDEVTTIAFADEEPLEAGAEVPHVAPFEAPPEVPPAVAPEALPETPAPLDEEIEPQQKLSFPTRIIGFYKSRLGKWVLAGAAGMAVLLVGITLLSGQGDQEPAAADGTDVTAGAVETDTTQVSTQSGLTVEDQDGSQATSRSAVSGGSFNTDNVTLDHLQFASAVDENDQPVDISIFFPSQLSQLCLFWDFAGMENGMAWGLSWYLEGEYQEAFSSPTQSWNGGSSGNWWACISADTGLDDGLYEVVLEVEGDSFASESVFVGGDRETVTMSVANNSDGVICYVQLSPTRALNWGPDELGSQEVIQSGQTRDIEITSGTYDIRLLDCDHEILAEQFQIEVAQDTTYTLSQ
jgi:serine/threonine protein kinase